MVWQPPALQGDVFVQGIIHLDDSQQQVVRYEAVREDAGLMAPQMFSHLSWTGQHGLRMLHHIVSSRIQMEEHCH
eukprot:12922742-Prorocentrum_lima.AAC.1